MDHVKVNDVVLYVWSSASPPNDLQETVATIQEKIGSTGKLQVEHATILCQSEHGKSSFDVAFSGNITSDVDNVNAVLAEILKILKPNGTLMLKNSNDEKENEKTRSLLTLAGFASVTKTSISIKESTFEIMCRKPNFEVGKSSKLPLSFKKKANPDAAKVWTLSLEDTNDENIDIIDSDSLLDADDLKRPDLSGIKTDCGTSKSGRRRACKGCTCGLKEELSGAPAPTQKSACGSCYLGDAFRCASCPYLGMPPFKPGQQVSLSDRQLNPDIQT